MRAQVKIADTGVYLYTHWGSEELPMVLQRVLKSELGKSRIDDPEYLARIIFEAMIGDQRGTATGFGIGTSAHTDLEYPPIIIDCGEQTILSIYGLQTIQEFCQMELKYASYNY